MWTRSKIGKVQVYINQWFPLRTVGSGFLFVDSDPWRLWRWLGLLCHWDAQTGKWNDKIIYRLMNISDSKNPSLMMKKEPANNYNLFIWDLPLFIFWFYSFKRLVVFIGWLRKSSYPILYQNIAKLLSSLYIFLLKTQITHLLKLSVCLYFERFFEWYKGIFNDHSCSIYKIDFLFSPWHLENTFF